MVTIYQSPLTLNPKFKNIAIKVKLYSHHCVSCSMYSYAHTSFSSSQYFFFLLILLVLLILLLYLLLLLIFLVKPKKNMYKSTRLKRANGQSSHKSNSHNFMKKPVGSGFRRPRFESQVSPSYIFGKLHYIFQLFFSPIKWR